MPKEETQAQAQTQAFDFQPLGDGIKYAVHDGHLIVAVAMQGGRPSASGKMILTGSTGGWKDIPGTNLRMNLTAGHYARAR